MYDILMSNYIYISIYIQIYCIQRQIYMLRLTSYVYCRARNKVAGRLTKNTLDCMGFISQIPQSHHPSIIYTRRDRIWLYIRSYASQPICFIHTYICIYIFLYTFKLASKQPDQEITEGPYIPGKAWWIPSVLMLSFKCLDASCP